MNRPIKAVFLGAFAPRQVHSRTGDEACLIRRDCNIIAVLIAPSLVLCSGACHSMQPAAALISLLCAAADMDDTLVLTADADAASHAAVLDVLREAAPQVDADKVLERWKRLFWRAPWDSSHEARR